MTATSEVDMKITIVGAGNVGQALARGLLRAGHDVRLAVRRPVPDAPAPTVAVPGSADGADVVVLAVPFVAVREAMADLAPPAGVVLVDATNPFGRPVPDGRASGAQYVASLAPSARVVKAFNVLGAEHLADPELAGGVRALLPVAADDDAARALVRSLARDLGFDAVDVGGLAAAHLLEEAARYWGLLAGPGRLGRGFALAALPTRRGTPAGSR